MDNDEPCALEFFRDIGVQGAVSIGSTLYALLLGSGLVLTGVWSMSTPISLRRPCRFLVVRDDFLALGVRL